MQLDDQKVVEILLEEKYISNEDLKSAAKEAEKSNVSTLIYLINNGFLSVDIIGQAVAEFYGVPYADLNTNSPTAEHVRKIPEEIARSLGVVVYKEDEQEVALACNDPGNKEILEKLGSIFGGKKIVIFYGMPMDIEKSFIHYKKNLAARFSKIIRTDNKIAPELVLEIVNDAVYANASDIHFEPRGEVAMVRFRVDGSLREMGSIARGYYENMVNYLKISSGLRIDEHRATQDGAIRFPGRGGDVDVRLSIIPVVEGEKAVLRMLSRNVGGFSMESIGFSERDQNIFESAIKKPFGMIIVSGPTGSGKTTTLYSLIKKISNSEINVTTIEDPVEYIIDSANQIQVNTAAGVTFAKGLRSIVRQDPDVILVGEIRDRETAEIAVNAALTGHLLFSTFHANNAATTFLRLVDMGIERFLLSSTIELVAAQRLLRRICEKCRASQPVTKKYISKFPPKFSAYLDRISTIYLGEGCSVCNGTGYRDRVAAFEIIKVTPEMQELLMKNPTAAEIWKLAQSQGSQSLFEDAAKKAELGVTTFEEVFRVAPPQ